MQKSGPSDGNRDFEPDPDFAKFEDDTQLSETFTLSLTREEGMLLLTSAKLLDRLVAGITIHARSRDQVIKDVIRLLADQSSKEVVKVSDELSNAIVESVLGAGEEDTDLDFELDDDFAMLTEAISLNLEDDFILDSYFAEAANSQASNADFSNLPSLTAEGLNSPMYKIDDTLPLIEQALVGHLTIKVQYYSFAREAIDDITLNPLVMMKENNLWKMAAFCHERNEIMIFKVDRIKAILGLDLDRDISSDFEPPKNIANLSYNYNRLPQYI